jgi:gliding motility-associated-like protein
VNLTITVPLTAQVVAVSNSLPDVFTGQLLVTNIRGGLPSYETRITLDSAAVIGQVFQTSWEEVNQNLDFKFEINYPNVPAGRYLVEVSDSLDCIISMIARIELNTDISIPNIFTPNGDGVNDVFYIRNLPTETQLVISNRWGKEVFSAANYQNDWNGGEIIDGIYYYRMNASGQSFTGWVEILRGK